MRPHAILFAAGALRSFEAFAWMGGKALRSAHVVVRSKSDWSMSATVEGRRYAAYNIYKGKGALCLKIVSPTWTKVKDGQSYFVSKEGGLLFEFAPATTTPKEYDWSKKATFLLDVTECGDLLTKRKDGCEFIHDPGALSATAGQVIKKMKWTPMSNDNGIFVSLSITDRNNVSASGLLNLPLTWGEFFVLDSIIRYSIPRFLGMDKCFGEPGMIYFGGKDEIPPTPPPVPAYKSLD
jgi:hypothetical protein